MSKSLLLVSVIVTLFFANCDGISLREKYNYNEIRNSSVGTFVKHSDRWIHYEFSGLDSGNIAVLIHGGTIPMCVWDPQIEALPTAGIRVPGYDQFGKGLSDRPDTNYNRSLFKRQLVELLDSLDTNQPVDLPGPKSPYIN